jgi:hypothetical protein
MSRLRVKLGRSSPSTECEQRPTTALAVPSALESRLRIPPIWRDFGGIRPRCGSEIDITVRHVGAAASDSQPCRDAPESSLRTGGPIRQNCAGCSPVATWQRRRYCVQKIANRVSARVGERIGQCGAVETKDSTHSQRLMLCGGLDRRPICATASETLRQAPPCVPSLNVVNDHLVGLRRARLRSVCWGSRIPGRLGRP